ncbi:MAG: hypothetical protein COZ70_00695 [Deltaproteobacteria bacterium CG_4_8_14_3_um_filter_51_11]|nr:MlaE family lipid ABC transporter permease subunit [bacterium]OIP41581.1 MAG: hypothetical protein AUK25_05475 [Desulfobacteraceae bacterium CG2_30_51_40]PIP48111.1 MAG: hypothetical protein COX16_01990 [Deltaproteobacteria bacterium CG23_combo_of_CG06-09_8_20_14_all_51_20]PIW00020.1 MAG: hypothetical protein COW41_06525 [Deltaproteobacteria bacterium CG17_big_fil_post_rev_8_21_14_2_50_51_6]PIX20998.1 MAG: hypothetical protein COZ70_00695 [Deltaproteobacteria bacterium CG_4_8_14_3_um_filter_
MIRKLTDCCSIEDIPGGDKKFRFSGRLDRKSVPAIIEAALKSMHANPPSKVTADLSGVSYLDDFGVLALERIREAAAESQASFALEGLGAKAKEILALFRFDERKKREAAKRRRKPGLMVGVGRATIDQLLDLRFQVAFVGSVLLCCLHLMLHPRSLRWEDTLESMKKTGADALPIVALIGFLLGLIMAFMSSVQLKQFGANIYVASLVALAMVRELGPIITAIIVAGRSGSAFASEIAAMKISDEVDALYTMGFDVTRFLVAPKIIAALLVVPILSIFANLFAILGGLTVGVLMLDLTAGAYMDQTFKSFTAFDFWFGLFKSAFFALVIAWMGCLRGFQARGGAEAVGKATTSAVVSSIFLIILWDSIFAVIIQYWG